jgi:hypothetical protein
VAARGRPRIYDWPTRFSKDRFVLIRGRDYNVTTRQIVQQLRCFASNRGFKVKIVAMDDHRVSVSVSRPEGR